MYACVRARICANKYIIYIEKYYIKQIITYTQPNSMRPRHNNANVSCWTLGFFWLKANVITSCATYSKLVASAIVKRVSPATALFFASPNFSVISVIQYSQIVL